MFIETIKSSTSLNIPSQEREDEHFVTDRKLQLLNVFFLLVLITLRCCAFYIQKNKE